MLRKVRIVLAVLFFAASVAYFTLGTSRFAALGVVEKVQILPSVLAVSIGVTVFWIGVTFLVGRVYCSTVCPLGTYQDFFFRLGKWLGRKTILRRLVMPGSYRAGRRARYHILAIYLLALILGVTAVSYWLEPWNLMKTACSAVNPELGKGLWGTLGIGTVTGIAVSAVIALLLAICALVSGRGYCTSICPVGTALGCLDSQTLYHIEIDPDKCVNCMKCEETCKSHCIDVSTRWVDNSRCVRCFDCLDVCVNDAIRFQHNRNRRATPMMSTTR